MNCGRAQKGTVKLTDYARLLGIDIGVILDDVAKEAEEAPFSDGNYWGCMELSPIQ